MKNDLKEKAIKGISWNLIENFSSYFIRFFIGIILARLLTPADYGLIAMTVIFFSIAEVFINSGFGQAYIQKKDANEEDANTVFITNFIISLLVYVIFWFSAPLIADFFNQPLLVKLIRVMSVMVILNSLNIIQLAIIRKNLEFKKKTLISLAATVISGITGIICAYRGFNVWSLVIQQISNRLMICLGLYFSSKWRLHFKFSFKSFKILFSYGSWLLFSNTTIQVFNNLYRFIIGKFFPASQLGLFDRGNQFPSMIYQQFSWSVGAVAFPVYSKLQNNKDELENSLLKFVKYSTFITLPLLAVLFIVAKPFVLLLLTEKWAGAIIFIKLYCIIGIVSPLYEFLTQFIEAIGGTKNNFIYTLFMNVMRIINVFINLKHGIAAILIGEIIVILIALLTVSLVSKRYMGFNFLSILYRIKWLFLSVILSLFFGWGVLLLCPSNLILELLLPSITMVFVYMSVLFLKEKQLILGILSFIRNRKM